MQAKLWFVTNHQPKKGNSKPITLIIIAPNRKTAEFNVQNWWIRKNLRWNRISTVEADFDTVHKILGDDIKGFLMVVPTRKQHHLLK